MQLRYLSVLLLLIIGNTAAQPVYTEGIGFKLESIAHLNIGWQRIAHFTETPKAKTLGGRNYTAQQIGYTQKFITWMQQSYTPKGCLGDVGYYQNAVPKYNPYNAFFEIRKNEMLDALPHLYGAQAKIHMFLKKDGQGKFVPQNNLADNWFIEANGLQHFTYGVPFLSSGKDYYFVMPQYPLEKGNGSKYKKEVEFLNFHNHSNLQAYQHYYLPPFDRDKGNWYVVLLTKDHKPLPFEEITIGEFFAIAEKQLLVEYENTLNRKPSDPYKLKTYYEDKSKREQSLVKAQTNLARLKEKYKNKRNDTAKLRFPYGQIGFADFVSATEENDDFFDSRQGVDAFPILRVDKQALELCKTNEPQWIVVRWNLMENTAHGTHLMESIMNNFNFKYLYNYFYGKGNVNEPYKPLIKPATASSE